MSITRRGFVGGLIAVVAAPAIVRPGLIMPIKPSLVPAIEPLTMLDRYVVDRIVEDASGVHVECSGLFDFGPLCDARSHLCDPWKFADTIPHAALENFEQVTCQHDVVEQRPHIGMRERLPPVITAVTREFKFSVRDPVLVEQLRVGSFVQVETNLVEHPSENELKLELSVGYHRMGFHPEPMRHMLRKSKDQ